MIFKMSHGLVQFCVNPKYSFDKSYYLFIYFYN